MVDVVSGVYGRLVGGGVVRVECSFEKVVELGCGGS